MNNKMTVDVSALIKQTNGKIFTVQFYKRTTGELRTMNCRLGVHKDLKGEGLKFDPAKKNLIVVYDMQAKDYRSINLDSILSIKMNGMEIYNNNIYNNLINRAETQKGDK